ncbi:mitochondrial nucleoid-associated protein 1 isoform X2 [Ascaphus truei]|uniref:mitochondrial nucleoid-associated protein 1 isoform X2 n=1 Tax=Ascaphus truei TaxID=8439 RepID=UPI003F5A9722
MDVRLGELPSWLSHHSFLPTELPRVLQKAWGRYHGRYSHVRRGGVGSLTMLLAGYCALSYAWNYEHIKRDRWRRYH